MKATGLIQKAGTALLVIDVQGKLAAVVEDSSQLLLHVNHLIKGAAALDIPIILTEQYPKGLGNTCPEIEIPEGVRAIEKLCFSCMQSEEVLQQLKAQHITSLILCGAEAHICVLQTALEALGKNFEVHVVADAVSSRTAANKQLALERMRQAGAFIVSTEMILFQLTGKAGTEVFKTISRIIK